MSDELIVLPNKEELSERLLAVQDSSHLQQGLYQTLLAESGKEKSVQGVAIMLSLALLDYIKDLPQSVVGIVCSEAPNFIDALVTDQTVAQQVKSAYEQMHSAPAV